jgi:hypothetical protein
MEPKAFRKVLQLASFESRAAWQGENVYLPSSEKFWSLRPHRGLQERISRPHNLHLPPSFHLRMELALAWEAPISKATCKAAHFLTSVSTSSRRVRQIDRERLSCCCRGDLLRHVLSCLLQATMNTCCLQEAAPTRGTTFRQRFGFHERLLESARRHHQTFSRTDSLRGVIISRQHVP